MRRRLASALALLALVALLVACSDDDAATDDDAPTDDASADTGPAIRFCDAYLDYLSEPDPDNLDTVEEAADDDQVSEYAEIIRSDDRTGRVIAADDDLEELARERCQAEWIAGAQGAGDAPSAAQAFFDAVIAGDDFGARNVASANAIAVFEPWEPVEADEDTGSPALVSVDEDSFSMVLGPETLAECQVETGVVIACTLAE